MEAVNLLPAYARPGHPWAAVGKDLSARRVLKAGSVVACVAVLGLGLGYVHERSVVNDRRAALADVQAEVAVADAKAAPFRSAQAAAAARMAAAGTVSSRRIAWEAAARRPLARAAEAGLPAEPVRCSRRRRWHPARLLLRRRRRPERRRRRRPAHRASRRRVSRPRT